MELKTPIAAPSLHGLLQASLPHPSSIQPAPLITHPFLFQHLSSVPHARLQHASCTLPESTTATPPMVHGYSLHTIRGSLHTALSTSVVHSWPARSMKLT
eukprot:1159755-Pelagomonas_calceolata.AAC.4